MATCSGCGADNRPQATFCDGCGARLRDAPPPREVRKTVTVLFCDVTGSTALGESTDPEALRALLARYFERMKGIVERHGGTVEKFIGDAVMAVFGVPAVHEDDALRACRAAVEMRDALPELGVQARIGVNTGEVVTGTAERLVTGDAVNVAARLEAAARPGEILIGPETHRLVGGTVEAEAVEPLVLKGKSEPLAAHRLLRVRDEQARQFATPLIGRETELRRLQDTFTQARDGRSCQLFTVLGMAGAGKSRLAAEFVARVDADVVRGRCFSYGEGITYAPVVEIVRQVGASPTDRAAAVAIRSLLGEESTVASAEEIAWAFRRLLEEQAQERPLVVVFDDIHWGEQTFLDLIEHVADLARDAPLLVLCLARPELLEKRPTWGGGKWNSTTVLLDPLDAEQADRLIDSLGGVDDALREPIRAAAEGNPLFLEEMLTLVRDSADGNVQVPPTIQALLAARLDALDAGDRAVLEIGAVEGRVFHRGSVQALTDDPVEVSTRLVSLVRKELLRPDRTSIAGDDAYRFRHVLIRDAAYDALPKAARADLHERLATWLDAHDATLVERDEILGHHLEQAARYCAELARPRRDLAERAADHLAAAGRRALWRADYSAADSLLARAIALLEPDVDVVLELDRGTSQMTWEGQLVVAEAAAERARARGDRAGWLLAHLVAEQHRDLFSNASPSEDDVTLADELQPLLEEAGDDAALVYLWFVRFAIAARRMRWEDATRAKLKQLEHSERAWGHRRGDLHFLASTLVAGPRPADEALALVERLEPESPPPLHVLSRALLVAMTGRLDEAWAAALAAYERWSQQSPDGRFLLPKLAELAIMSGDRRAAADYFRTAYAFFEGHDHKAGIADTAARLARELVALDEYDEAERLALRARELGSERDPSDASLWRRALALVRASGGSYDEAERLAREAVEILGRTDALNDQATAYVDLADVLAAAGQHDEAASALARALQLFEQKRNLPLAGQVRARLVAANAR